MAPAPTVWVVDDDADVRDALTLLLQAHGLAVRPCPGGTQLLEQLTPDQPGCVVLDVRMPRMGGLEVQREMAARQLQQPIVFLTGHADVPMAVTALRAKAFHFLEKPVKDRDLLAAVGQALAHDANERRGRQHAARARALVQSLTPREAEVARLVASGLRTEEIAHRLGLSARTIDMHRARLLQRLGARTSAEAARILQDGGGLAGA